MTFKSIVFIGLVLSLNSITAYSKVTCSGEFYSVDQSGRQVSGSVVRVQKSLVVNNAESTSTMLGSSVLISSLRDFCPGTNACPGYYILTSTLKTSSAETATESVISPTTDKSFHQALLLRAGNSSVFVNCVLE